MSEEKLKELGIELPEAPIPAGNYIPAVKNRKVAFHIRANSSRKWQGSIYG